MLENTIKGKPETLKATKIAVRCLLKYGFLVK
jgi:hypothetical protein